MGLMRSATPLLKNVGKTLFRAGVGVAKYMSVVGTFKNSVKHRGVGALNSLLGKVFSPGKTTAPKKAGTKWRKRSPQTGSGGSCKRRRGDIFDC